MNRSQSSSAPVTFVSGLVTLLFFLLPFERIPSFSVHGFTVKLSYIVGVILLLTLVLKAPLELFRRLPITRSDYILAAFWLIGLISVVFSPLKSRSLIIVLVWGFIFLLYLVVSRLLTSEKLRYRIDQAILFSTLLVCLFGIYQFLGDSFGLSPELTGLRQQYTKIVFGFPRIQSVALEPLYFSNFLLVPLSLASSYFVKTKNFFNRYSVLVFLIVLNIALGISRGAYLAVLVTMPLLALCFWLQNRELAKKTLALLGIMLAAALTALLGVYVINGKSATHNFAGHASVDDTQVSTSVPGRLATYKLALTYFRQKPLLGNGVASFGPLTVTSNSELKEFGYGIVNNEYLEILEETGVIGLGLFIAFLLILAWEWWQVYQRADRSNQLIRLALFWGLVAVLIQYNFFSTLYIMYIWMFLAYLKSFAFFEKA